MAETVLFGSPLSPFVKKVMGALALKKVPYELTEPAGPRDLAKWSPVTGKMPVLEIDGERVYDSTLICARLEKGYPQPPLLAADARVCAAQRLLEDWADESLYWSIMALRWSAKNEPATLAQITGGMPFLMRRVARPILRRQIGRQPRFQGLGRLPVDVLVRELGTHLDDLVALLGERPFFHADEPSIADLAVAGELETGTSGPSPEVNELLAARPVLVAHLERVRQAAFSAA